MRARSVSALAFAFSLFLPAIAAADPVLSAMAPVLDPPTLTALGVLVPISGDDNFNATIGVRFRKVGDADWREAMPLFRVHAELVVGMTSSPAFAGSIFDLRPSTTYEIELHATDADGNVDTTMTTMGTTRAVPADPTNPHVVNVTDAASLSSALSAAKAGDVITLANGNYGGQFSMQASGTAADPIVIRGETQDGVVLDGMSCDPCNVLEIYGSFVHVERLTIAHGDRGIRWQGQGADQNVLRRVHITDVRSANGTKDGQTNFYIADNIVEGRLAWPLTYADDGAIHASDEGLIVTGTGHVVCHNRVSGFGDALNTDAVGAVANDFYGNDVLWTYDDGLELDETTRNGRAFRNRFTNTYDTISFQPVFGGPAYAFRNVIVNVANEALKLHALGGNPPEVPVGVVLSNNTFVRPYHAFQTSTSDSLHEYVFRNNLFVGPDAPQDGLTVMWDTPIDSATASLDYDGFYPDGMFEMGYGATGHKYASFAELMAGGLFEPHGVLLTGANFASGLVAPTDHKALLAPADATLDGHSLAVDRGIAIPQITDGYQGTAPDLGALELGCPSPIYGPRPEGMDESNQVVDCVTTGAGGQGAGGAGTGGNATGGNGTGGTATGGAANGGQSSGGSSAAGGAGKGGSGGSSSAGKGGSAGTTASGGAHSQAGSSGKSSVPSAGGSGGSGVEAPAANDADSGDSGGCGCRTSPLAQASWSPAWIAAIALFMRRRKSKS